MEDEDEPGEELEGEEVVEEETDNDQPDAANFANEPEVEVSTGTIKTTKIVNIFSIYVIIVSI